MITVGFCMKMLKEEKVLNIIIISQMPVQRWASLMTSISFCRTWKSTEHLRMITAVLRVIVSTLTPTGHLAEIIILMISWDWGDNTGYTALTTVTTVSGHWMPLQYPTEELLILSTISIILWQNTQIIQSCYEYNLNIFMFIDLSVFISLCRMFKIKI